jgi:hypothetical protein
MKNVSCNFNFKVNDVEIEIAADPVVQLSIPGFYVLAPLNGTGIVRIPLLSSSG